MTKIPKKNIQRRKVLAWLMVSESSVHGHLTYALEQITAEMSVEEADRKEREREGSNGGKEKLRGEKKRREGEKERKASSS